MHQHGTLLVAMSVIKPLMQFVGVGADMKSFIFDLGEATVYTVAIAFPFALYFYGVI
jgi:hypothetical protein